MSDRVRGGEALASAVSCGAANTNVSPAWVPAPAAGNSTPPSIIARIAYGDPTERGYVKSLARPGGKDNLRFLLSGECEPLRTGDQVRIYARRDRALAHAVVGARPGRLGAVN